MYNNYFSEEKIMTTKKDYYITSKGFPNRKAFEDYGSKVGHGYYLTCLKLDLSKANKSSYDYGSYVLRKFIISLIEDGYAVFHIAGGKFYVLVQGEKILDLKKLLDEIHEDFDIYYGIAMTKEYSSQDSSELISECRTKMYQDSDPTTKTSYSTIESGHTCNIKDILCMVDVMYNMESNDVGLASEDKVYNLMGASPEQVSFDDAVDNVAGFFKWLWNTIKSVNPFGSTEYEPLKNFCNDKVGMKTIIKYAETLYESSHQQEVALSIEYYNTDPLIVQTSSGAKDISLTTSQTDASILGYCVSPVTTDFYLKWNDSRVSPYFTQNEDGTGTQYIVDLPTSQSGYKVQIDMSDMADGETACLKSNMGSNEATYNYIKSLTTA